MLLIKYRIINDDGSWVETIKIEEAEKYGNFIIVEEFIPNNNEEIITDEETN